MRIRETMTVVKE